MRRTGAAEITLKTLPEMDKVRAQEETSWMMRAQCWTRRAPTPLLARPVTLRAKVSHPFCRLGNQFGLREVLQRTNSIGRLLDCAQHSLCSWTRAVHTPQEPAVACTSRVVREDGCPTCLSQLLVRLERCRWLAGSVARSADLPSI